MGSGFFQRLGVFIDSSGILCAEKSLCVVKGLDLDERGVGGW